MLNANRVPVGVVALRLLLTTRRGVSLTEFMFVPLIVPAHTLLEEEQNFIN